MKLLQSFLVFLGFAAFGAGLANAQPRIALVVGNSVYQSVPSLDNPSNDARLIASTLEAQGFDVTLLIDSDLATMKRGVSQFGRALRNAGPDATGLFYYAGHGVQSFGKNYLVPTDAALTDAADLDLVSIDASAVLRQMRSARNQTNIVILDACRNNPFVNIPEFDDPGLAEMKAPVGTFLSYATEPGGVALDGLDGNSPYSKALAREISVPGLKIEETFKNVRVAVLKETGGRQTPWDTSSLTNEFVFKAAAQVDPEELAERQLWESVQATRDPVQIMLFLRAYPQSRFGDDARKLLDQVMEAELSGTADNTSQQAAAPAASGPSEREQTLYDQAQVAATVEGYQNYLREFPQGMFAEFARTEIAAIRAKEAKAAAAAAAAAKPAEQQTAAVQAPAGTPSNVLNGVPSEVSFLKPLEFGDPAIVGKTLAEVIKSSPIFPPVEGLPESFWKTKTCSNCHQWERANLCDQARTYLAAETSRALNKEHPFGGTLKRNLMVWAKGGCQ